MNVVTEIFFSMGAKIPPANSETEEKHPSHEEKTFVPEETETKHEEPEETLPPLDLDESGVIPPEDDAPLPMGDLDKEVRNRVTFEYFRYPTLI